MRYKIFIEKKAERDFDKLPKKFKKNIIAKILNLEDAPRPRQVRKIKSLYYRIRVGDWRVIYEIKDKERRVNIFRIRHRREVYKNL